MAVDASGGTTLMWSRRTTGTNLVLQTTSRPAGGGFSAPQDIGPVLAPFLGILNNSSLAVDAHGNAIAVWPAAGGIIRAAYRPAGGSFGAPVDLSTGTDNFDPHLAMSPNGTAVVTWIDDTTVRAASRAPGGAFGGGAPLGSTGGNGLATPQVAVSDAGGAAVVWSADPGDGNNLIRARVRGPGAAFSAQQTLSSAGEPASFPDVEMDSAGRATAIWTRSNGLHNIVQSAATMAGSTTFGAVDELSDVGASASFPQVAIDAQNTAVAVWVRNQIVESATRASGGSFTAPALVSGPGASAAIPRVAMDAAGNAVAVWSQDVGSDRIVQASRRPQGGSFGSVDPISSGGSASFPNAVYDNEGNIVAAWAQTQGDTTQVAQVAAFDAAAPTLNAVAVPSAGTAGQGVGMAAAATDRWSHVALHWNFGDGGTASGGAVTHAFGGAGAFNVTVTATDGVGNATSATRPIAISPGPPPPPPPPTPTITSPVKATWALRGKKLAIVRLVVRKAPKGAKAQVRCKGKKCPFKRKASKKRRKGSIRLFKGVKAAKALSKKKRNFRRGQRVEVRITKRGYIGKVVRYRIKKAKIPVGKTRCLPVGAKKPRKRC